VAGIYHWFSHKSLSVPLIAGVTIADNPNLFDGEDAVVVEGELGMDRGD